MTRPDPRAVMVPSPVLPSRRVPERATLDQAQLGQHLLAALTTARWPDGTLLVDVDPSVLTERIIQPFLRPLTLLAEMPCLLDHQDLGPWEPVDADDQHLSFRRCFCCGAEQIVTADAPAPVHHHSSHFDESTQERRIR